MLIEYPLWSIWLKKGVPLDELKYRWTYDDLLRSQAMIDMESAYDGAIHEMMSREK